LVGLWRQAIVIKDHWTRSHILGLCSGKKKEKEEGFIEGEEFLKGVAMTRSKKTKSAGPTDPTEQGYSTQASTRQKRIKKKEAARKIKGRRS